MIEHADRRGRDPVGSEPGIRTVEQIAERAPVVRVHPAPAPVLRAVVEHVAALAERRELVEGTVARIMVEVRAGQYNRRPSPLQQNVFPRPSHASTLAVAPVMPFSVPPSSIP